MCVAAGGWSVTVLSYVLLRGESRLVSAVGRARMLLPQQDRLLKDELLQPLLRQVVQLRLKRERRLRHRLAAQTGGRHRRAHHSWGQSRSTAPSC